MYPKNTATPRPLYAKVANALDGAPITTGVVAYHIHGDDRNPVDGDPAEHIANGLWIYTPTRAEGNYDAFSIEFYHTDAIGHGPIVRVLTGPEE